MTGWKFVNNVMLVDIIKLRAHSKIMQTTDIKLIYVVLIVIATIWSAIWKGFALWRAARLGDRTWFIMLMFVNTVGILEILYLTVSSKKGEKTISTDTKQ